MNTRTSALLLALALGSSAGLVQAHSPEGQDGGRPHAAHKKDFRGDGPRGERGGEKAFGQRAPKESFTEETVRKTADGKTSKRKVEQKVTDNSFSRKEQFTNTEGKTATRNVTATFDKDKERWSRKEEGSGFDGKSWSRSQEGQGKRGFGPRVDAGGKTDAKADSKKAG